MYDTYLLSFYVPETHLEKVLEVVFSAGAGRYKAYDRCAWSTDGKGRFRPLENSEPYLGRPGEDTMVPEIKVECLVPGDRRSAVEQALLSEHPYEEPAFHFLGIGH
ncbi:MAG: hypothetical protein RQ767_06275 [Thermovirgaceae bacterium]|nr:hypothetical protein [Thermovirgaceae bacterium]